MARIVKPITIKVTSEAGKARLAADVQRKHELKSAIQKKTPAEEIEKKFDVKFVTPL